jgi:polygalacturonase
MSIRLERRRFLKNAMATTLAAPMLASLDTMALGQESGKPRKAAKGPASPSRPALTLNVRDYGATGDGSTKDTLAIQLAIERCSALGGGTVVLPAGNYLSGALSLRSNVALHVEEKASLLGSPDLSDYPLAEVRWEGRWIKGYSAFLSAVDAQDFSISGPGKIVGSPAVKGRIERETQFRLPALMEFFRCNNVKVENCFTKNYGMWSIHPTYCESISFANLKVESGADGIDVDSCRHVTIDHCDFQTADDCISLKSGRGEEGLTINWPTEDVHISNCTFSDVYFACIGIGSETSAGIRDVFVDHCKCMGARTFAIYIKSRVGRGAFIENIVMNDLEVSGAKQGFLRFNLLNSGKQDEFPVPGEAGIPTIRNFRFSNVRVTDVPVLVEGININPLKPLDGLTLSNVTGTCGKGIFLANVKHAEIRNIKVTGYSGPLLNVSHVSGAGLAGAAQIAAADLPKPVSPIPQPATPYDLH